MKNKSLAIIVSIFPVLASCQEQDSTKKNGNQSETVSSPSSESNTEAASFAFLDKNYKYIEEVGPEKAIVTYTDFLSKQSGQKEQVAKAIFYRGIAYGEINKRKDAIADYSQVISMEGAPTDLVCKALVNRGLMFGAADRDKAIADYTNVIERKGVQSGIMCRALAERGEQYEETNTSKAVADYSAILAVPDAPVGDLGNAYVKLGYLHLRNKEVDKAVSFYSRAIEHQGLDARTLIDALYSRACAYTLTHLRGQPGASCLSVPNRLELVIADCTRIVALKDADGIARGMALHLRGTAAIELGKTEDALADYGELIETQGARPRDIASALANRASIYEDTNRIEDAIRDYSRTVALEGADVGSVAQAYFNRGAIFGIQLGDSDRALADYKNVIALNGCPPDILAGTHLNRADIFRKRLQKEDAITECEAALKQVNEARKGVPHGGVEKLNQIENNARRMLQALGR